MAVRHVQILKYVLNHSRPDGAPKKDPGMPSTHATALASLGASACLGILAGPGPAVYRWTAASCLGALSSFLVSISLLLHWDHQEGGVLPVVMDL